MERLPADQFELEVIALTRGSAGSSLYKQGAWSHRASKAVSVIDTVGAGDAFSAALVMSLLHRRPLEEIHDLAVYVAQFVCSQAGATPWLPDTLRKRLGTQRNLFGAAVWRDHVDLNVGSTRREIDVVADFGAQFHLPVIVQGRTLC